MYPMTFRFICRTVVQLQKPHRTVFVVVLFLDYIPVKSRFYRKNNILHALFYNFLPHINQINVFLSSMPCIFQLNWHHYQ